MSLSLLRKYKSWFLKAKRICILSTYCVCLARDYIRIRKTNEFLAPDRSILPTIWIRVQDDVSIFINHPQIYMVFVAAILVMWYANGKSRSTEQIFSQMKINTYEYKRIQLSYWFTVLHVHCIHSNCLQCECETHDEFEEWHHKTSTLFLANLIVKWWLVYVFDSLQFRMKY